MSERLRYLGNQAYEKRNILLPVELVSQLEQQGLDQGLSLNEVINLVLANHYKQQEGEGVCR